MLKAHIVPYEPEDDYCGDGAALPPVTPAVVFDRRPGQSCMPTEDFVRVAKAMLAALEYMHAEGGLVHGDVKVRACRA